MSSSITCLPVPTAWAAMTRMETRTEGRMPKADDLTAFRSMAVVFMFCLSTIFMNKIEGRARFF